MTDHHPNVRDIVEVDGQFYILATSALAEAENLVLKCGDTFGVFDRFTDITPLGLHEQGLYHEGTRFLSTLLVRLGWRSPLLLSSGVKDDNALITVDLTNVDVFEDGHLVLKRGALHLSRTTYLGEGVCCTRLAIQNYDSAVVAMPLMLSFDADFADIFEVRGTRRVRRGVRIEPRIERDLVALGYRGLDDVVRQTTIQIEPAPALMEAGLARIDLSLPPGGEATYDVTVSCDAGGAKRSQVAFAVGLRRGAETLASRYSEYAEIRTSSEPFNDWLQRSVSDLAMMTTETSAGPYPYAGVPWFSTPFGRDGLITALECLWVNPTLARGVLGYLAGTQATADLPDRDAQPGKILHEARDGEMAALGEVPFHRYYGSHDATPLFVMLAAAYFESTGDRDLIEQLYPHIDRALEWMARCGDRDGDGFLEYERVSPDGLVNQGWKDSHDAVMHRDGRLAEGPIALCEVQAYAYGAWRGAAALARATDRTARAVELETKAEALREHFDASFWSEELGTYVLALDGEKRPCLVRASNAGHVLFTRLARPDRARRVAETMRAPETFSGWGIRTLASCEAAFNPMSYHNGSIWPHDNALVASGFAKYGLKEDVTQILTGLFDASTFVSLHRLPELFCGFSRRPGERPTLYPVACAPQAWASGAVFLLLQSTLGLEIHAPHKQLVLRRAHLPPSLGRVQIRNLRVGSAVVDLALERHKLSVGLEITRREGDVEVITVK